MSSRLPPPHLSIGVDAAEPFGLVHLGVDGDDRARVRARAVALPCPTSSIDRITIRGGLEGLRRSEAVALLRECRRILRPDGRLTLGALNVDAILAGPIEPDDAGELTRRLRACRWIGAETELRELASQVGLMPRTLDPVPGREENRTEPSILEFTKPVPSLSKDRPLVSVLIPAYKPRFFAEALDSVLAQTYENLEVVICDDCPTDEIQGVVARHAARDPRIRYSRNESRLGSNLCHIRCLGLASGELIKFLSDDDRLHPACLERMVACLTAFPEVTLVTSHRQCIDETGAHLADLDGSLRPVSEDSRVDGAALARAMLLHGGLNIVGGPSTTMFRRADLVDTRPNIFSFAGRPYASMGDIVMWFNLLSKGDAIYLVETLSYFRLHAGQEMREEWVRAAAEQNVARMQVDGGRMGLIPEDAPTELQWMPLGASRPWWPGPVTEGVGQVPDDPWRLVLLARAEEQSGDLDAALPHLERAAAVGPDLPYVHGELASVMHRLGRDEAAEAAAKRTLTLNPSNRAALSLLAEVLDARRRHAGIAGVEAEPQLDGGIDHWPAEHQLIGGLVAMEGWLVSQPPVATDVRVLVDGCAWPAWVRRMSGLNTAPPAYWLAPPNSRPRFRLMIDTRRIPDGRHVLTIVALGAGRTLPLGQRPVVIRNREILGVADGPAAEVVDHLVRERDEATARLARMLQS